MHSRTGFEQQRLPASRFRGAESDWRAEKSTRFNSGARDSSRFHKEAFARRGKDSRRGQSRSEQSTVALQAQQRRCDRRSQHNDNLREGSAFRYRSREPQRKVLVLEERVALLEKNVACLERELKAIHTKSSTVSIAPENAQQGLSHCGRVCPQTFGTSTQLHRHLRNSKHFSPLRSPAFSSQGVRASGSSAAPSPNEDVPFLRTSSGSLPTSVPVATTDVSDAAVSEDFIPQAACDFHLRFFQEMRCRLSYQSSLA
jgi:hypothetical protein